MYRKVGASMRPPHGVMPLVVAMLGALHGIAGAQAAADSGADRPNLQPAVASVIRAATAAYHKMNSYQHTAEYVQKAKQANGKVSAFTLALERPNRFCFRSENPDDGAAICDGKTFLNLKSNAAGGYYTRHSAPPTFQQIDIVDDVDFQPVGTYLIALMLQGDPLADRDVRAYL